MDAEQVDVSSNLPDYQKAFVRILNNRAKAERNREGARERGFVVIARGGTSLSPLQNLCAEQTYNPNCLTARYRLQPNRAIGTLIVAFFKDLRKILDDRERNILGGLMPDLSHDQWHQVSRNYFTGIAGEDRFWASVVNPKLMDSNQQVQGTLTPDILVDGFAGLESESVLGMGQRLVLFGELSEPCTDSSEWRIAMETLFLRLPERVGIVLSGAPEEFHLPTGDPHFLELNLPDGVAVSSSEGQAAYTYTDSSFHADEPANEDKLGVNTYANAIARFIVHPQTKAPLTVGINGRWGKGKSSFMRLVDTALVKYAAENRNVERSDLNGKTRLQHWDDLVKKLNSPNIGGEPGLSKEQLQAEHEKNSKEEVELWKLMRKDARKNVLTVNFNAWQFDDAKQIWAGLASQISETIESSLAWNILQRLKLSYAWKERKSELILNLLLPLAIVFIVAGLVYTGFFAKLGIGKPEGLAILLPAGSVLLTIWFVSSQLLKVAVPISERVLSYVRMPNYREQMGFQHRVKDDLRFLHKFLAKHRPGCRVVVYIDDLDRCSENKIMELLQAINLILASCEFFVFVGMDTEMIYRAIRSHYKETPTEYSPDSYLRKIVQISFYLPETRSQTRADYVNTLFSLDARLGLASRTNARVNSAQEDQTVTGSRTGPTSGLPYNLENVLTIVPIVNKEAEDTADELQAFRDYGDYLDDNPREIKRLINIHRLIKILIQKPNTPWPTDRQRKLVKWLIFCDRWPHLVDDVLEQQQNKDESLDILFDLATSLEAAEEKDKGSGQPPIPFYRLKEFAELAADGAMPIFGKPKPLDALLFADIDAEFRLAANLSQLISKSPAAPAKTKRV